MPAARLRGHERLARRALRLPPRRSFARFLLTSRIAKNRTPHWHFTIVVGDLVAGPSIENRRDLFTVFETMEKTGDKNKKYEVIEEYLEN